MIEHLRTRAVIFFYGLSKFLSSEKVMHLQLLPGNFLVNAIFSKGTNPIWFVFVVPSMNLQVVHAVEGKIPVLMDGGVRRGTDVFKALALGAKAVLVIFLSLLVNSYCQDSGKHINAYDFSYCSPLEILLLLL